MSKDYASINEQYRSTTNLYFSASTKPYSQNAIALSSHPKSIVNNLVCLTNTSPLYSSQGQLISVSLKEGIHESQANLIDKVKNEIAQWIPTAKNWKHIKTYNIRYALPNQTHINNANLISVNNKMTIIGDHTMNGSINAAMKSGRLGAERVIELG